MNYTGVLDVHDHLLIEEEMVHGRDERVALPLVGVGEVHLEPIPGDHQVRLADSLEHLVTMTTVPTLMSPTQATASHSVFLMMFWMTASVSVSSVLAIAGPSRWSVGKYVFMSSVLDSLDDIIKAWIRQCPGETS